MLGVHSCRHLPIHAKRTKGGGQSPRNDDLNVGHMRSMTAVVSRSSASCYETTVVFICATVHTAHLGNSQLRGIQSPL